MNEHAVKAYQWALGFAERIATKEPVLLGGAFLATLQARYPDMSQAVLIAWTAWISLLERMGSVPAAKIEAAHAAGYDKAVAELNELALAAQPTAA